MGDPPGIVIPYEEYEESLLLFLEESNISFPGEWESRISQNPRGWGSSSSSLGSLHRSRRYWKSLISTSPTTLFSESWTFLYTVAILFFKRINYFSLFTNHVFNFKIHFGMSFHSQNVVLFWKMVSFPKCCSVLEGVFISNLSY